MPIFFFVGGYSNRTSWQACQRRGETYADWLSGRLRRLLQPVLPLLALGMTQIGLALSFQRPARRWLDRPAPWTATVMINGLIMTLFLWHSTAMMLVIGAGFLLVPDLYAIIPGSLPWWAWRPVWLAVFALATVPFLLAFGRFEHWTAARVRSSAVGVRRLCAGCFLTCAALGRLALAGIGASPHWLFDALCLAMPFAGAALAGFGPGSVGKLVSGGGHAGPVSAGSAAPE